MRTTEENILLADLLFPDVTEMPEDIFRKYPKRNLDSNSMILRFAPSPTGFLHIGGVYTGLICSFLARQTKGISILRIEDTDKGREIENGISLIFNGLKSFGISFDEGVIDNCNDVGEYGPYVQSKRLNIYKVFTKYLVSKGYAYPCFLTMEELKKIREKQTEMGVRTGCYGQWAIWRDSTLEDIQKRLNNKEKFVIRLYSTGSLEKTFELTDLVKGKVTLRQNDMDSVLLKSDRYPTYHLAHPIDDRLMGITHVFRGDEWFASVPLHVELFEKLGFNLIPYGHISPLMKLDEGGKSRRKLSKRKDPEADIQYYIDHGYPAKGVVEYILNLANSNFYDWRKANPTSPAENFKLSIEKFNRAGALFDIIKLNDVCKEYISTLSAEEVYNQTLKWAETYNTDLAKLLEENREYCINIFNIEREGSKIRKDIVKFEDSENQLRIFFDKLLEKETFEDITEKISKELQAEIVRKYLEIYNYNDNDIQWFERIKKLASKLGFATDRKEYEKDKEKYKGMVGDVAMTIRVALTGLTKTPDLYQIMKVLGEQKVRERLEKYISKMI